MTGFKTEQPLPCEKPFELELSSTIRAIRKPVGGRFATDNLAAPDHMSGWQLVSIKSCAGLIAVFPPSPSKHIVMSGEARFNRKTSTVTYTCNQSLVREAVIPVIT